MQSAPLPPNEAERLAELRAHGLLDTEPEQALDDLSRIASQLCGTPIALVSLIDAGRQWFKAKVGLELSETPRDVAFCAHAILDPEHTLVVRDSHADPRFQGNPLTETVRFYAGVPLVGRGGLPLGTLCVIDRVPRELTPTQLESLEALSRQVVAQFELRRAGVELRRQNEELDRNNRELQRFTSIAAHDLQAPLRQLAAFCDVLEQDLSGDPARVPEDLECMRGSARRMQRLVTDLLRLAQAGAGDLATGEVPLGRCVDEALDQLAGQLRDSQARVHVEALPTVRGDAPLLTQVFLNLIGNALKFSGPEPRVSVTCEARGEELVFGVRDAGEGIPAGSQERVFDAFERLHGGSREGHGIGLAIVRAIVERHGGRVWVESQPGVGAHFRFVLSGGPASLRAAG